MSFDLPENPSLETFVSFMLEQRLADVHTCLPGKILKYDKATQKADVEILLQRKYLGDETKAIKLPPLSNVPVWHPRVKDVIVHMPVKVDDVVTVFFYERSVDRWLSQGGSVDPGDVRKHALSDAVAFPGGYPFSDPSPVTQDDAIEILAKDAEVRIGTDGKVSVKASEISLGDHSLSKHAAIGEATESRLSAIESKLSSFVTSYTAHMHPTAAPGPPSPPVVPETPFVPDTSVVSSSKVKVIE